MYASQWFLLKQIKGTPQANWNNWMPRYLIKCMGVWNQTMKLVLGFKKVYFLPFYRLCFVKLDGPSFQGWVIVIALVHYSWDTRDKWPLTEIIVKLFWPTGNQVDTLKKLVSLSPRCFPFLSAFYYCNSNFSLHKNLINIYHVDQRF